MPAQNSSRLPNSTTSPKSSPEFSTTRLTEISSSSIKEDDPDFDEDNENENISVTGSPDITCTNESETPLEVKSESGAFTSIIQKTRKNEFISAFPGNSSQLVGANPMINHALAAHLFFQNPLLPPSNQWLYNHLYNNYQDFPWLRHSLGLTVNSQLNQISNNANGSDRIEASSSGISLIKRSITLLTNNNGDNNDKENDSDIQSSSSPPVTSTKRSPTPEHILLNNIAKRKRSMSESSSTNGDCPKDSDSNNNRNRLVSTVKQNDVWRPY